MTLTNAERQARHRERQREKLRNAVPSEPLRNTNFLETMQFAFLVGERKGRTEALGGIAAKPLLPYDSGWDGATETLMGFDEDIANLTEEFFVGLIAAAGFKLGDRLVMETYRDFLAAEVEKSKPRSVPARKKARKRVT